MNRRRFPMPRKVLHFLNRARPWVRSPEARRHHHRWFVWSHAGVKNVA